MADVAFVCAFLMLLTWGCGSVRRLDRWMNWRPISWRE